MTKYYLKLLRIKLIFCKSNLDLIPRIKNVSQPIILNKFNYNQVKYKTTLKIWINSSHYQFLFTKNIEFTPLTQTTLEHLTTDKVIGCD